VSCNLPSFFMRRSASNSFMISFCTLCTWSWTHFFHDLLLNTLHLKLNSFFSWSPSEHSAPEFLFFMISFKTDRNFNKKQELLTFMITCCLNGTWGDTHSHIHDLFLNSVVWHFHDLFTQCVVLKLYLKIISWFPSCSFYLQKIFSTAYCIFM
jgi:hypothetical protein